MKNRKGRNNGLLPNSLRIISSCLKTVSSNATNVASSVRSAGASVAASVSASSVEPKDQVTWAGFDKLELSPAIFRRVLLLGYQTGFQVLDVEDASNFNELVSKRDGPVTFLQMQPFPADSDGPQRFQASHPLLLVVSGGNPGIVSLGQSHGHNAKSCRDGCTESELGHSASTATAVQFYSLTSHCYVHVLRFRSAVCMVRCSPRIVAVGLAAQIHCFDAITLENKFSVLTYPVPQLAGQGLIGVNFGYGPMAVGPRWLAYASNNPLSTNTGRLSPQNLTPPGVSPSTSPNGGNLVARYAMESSKHLAAGIISLGDMGYKTLSKCCQELLPDGSNSPVPSSSGWKVGRNTGAESDNAGMVAIKDFVSGDVICQFKAHTSPLSALCFDPSGTLLVSASVYGNTINVFRIMPSCIGGGSGSQRFSWSSAHVHLYRLHRGLTSAIIQDICFSHYSQWVGIVSSKGTCHVFVLSPFGGDPGFQGNNSKGEETSLYPSLSVPWWSSSSFMNSPQCVQPPPPPVILSVVSRIKYNDSGWLNTVSNAAASATGKVFVPSGAIAAIFHNSMSQSLQQMNVRSNALEYLLVYTPSGHVIQHKLLLPTGMEASHAGLKARPGSFLQIQEDELRVKVEPVQWWDVCRRSDWPEREDCNVASTFSRRDTTALIAEGEDNYGTDIPAINKIAVGKKPIRTDSSLSSEGSHWYLSNAEVQVSSGRIPFWLRLEVSLYTMNYPNGIAYVGGEFEIEKLQVQEVEIKQKELLPVFDHFHSIKSGWCGSHAMGPAFAPHELHQMKLNVAEETVICHSEPASLSSTGSSDGGSSRRIENLPDLDQANTEKSYAFACQSLDDFYLEKGENCLKSPVLLTQKSADKAVNYIDHPAAEDNVDGLSLLENKLPPPGIILNRPSVSKAESGNGVLDPDPADNVPKEETEPAVGHDPVGSRQLFEEGSGEAAELDCSAALNEAVNGSFNSCSQREKDKPEDGDNDEMLGGMFAFSEDG